MQRQSGEQMHSCGGREMPRAAVWSSGHQWEAGCVRGPPLTLPQSAREYRQRSLQEKMLLFFAYDAFGIPFVDPVSMCLWRGRGAGTGVHAVCSTADSAEKTVRQGLSQT